MVSNMTKKEFEKLCYERSIYARKSDKDKNVYILYNTNNGLDYIASVRFKSSKVYYNDKRYDDVDELLKAIAEHNEVAQRPVYLDDPLTRKGSLLNRAFSDYMEKLGYFRERVNHICGNDQTNVVLRNCYDGRLSEVNLLQRNADIDSFSGEICVNLSESSFLKVPFDGYEEMVASINSIIETELLCNQATLLKAIESMGNARNDRIAKISIDSRLNVTVEDGKNMLIEKMEKALERLRG